MAFNKDEGDFILRLYAKQGSEVMATGKLKFFVLYLKYLKLK